MRDVLIAAYCGAALHMAHTIGVIQGRCGDEPTPFAAAGISAAWPLVISVGWLFTPDGFEPRACAVGAPADD